MAVELDSLLWRRVACNLDQAWRSWESRASVAVYSIFLLLFILLCIWRIRITLKDSTYGLFQIMILVPGFSCFFIVIILSIVDISNAQCTIQTGSKSYGVEVALQFFRGTAEILFLAMITQGLLPVITDLSERLDWDSVKYLWSALLFLTGLFMVILTGGWINWRYPNSNRRYRGPKYTFHTVASLYVFYSVLYLITALCACGYIIVTLLRYRAKLGTIALRAQLAVLAVLVLIIPLNTLASSILFLKGEPTVVGRSLNRISWLVSIFFAILVIFLFIDELAKPVEAAAQEKDSMEELDIDSSNDDKV